MEVLEGQGVQRVVMTIDGVEYEVKPLKEAAPLIGYSKSSAWRLCDEGKLIAYKYAGRWWIPTSEIKHMRSKN